MKTRVQGSGFRIQETGTRACRLQRWRPDALVGGLLAFLCSALAATAAEPSARASFAAGLQAFAASNWPAASNAFLEAAAAAPAAKLDPAAAYFNAGLAANAGDDLKAAADSFARASSGSDLRLQSRAYYNRGNALFHQVGGPAAAAMPAAAPAQPLPAMSTQELADAEASVGEAIQMYENAIALDPKDVDAKANYELAVLKQQQIQQQKQQQQKQDQQKQDQQKQDQQKQDQSNPDQQKQDQQKQEEQQDQKQDQQQQQPQAEQKPQPEKQTGDKQQQEEQIKKDKPSEEMTPEEAAMMLDSMKAQEQSQRDRLHPFFGRPVPVEKDW